jgi:hypothetical protein
LAALSTLYYSYYFFLRHNLVRKTGCSMFWINEIFV